MNITSEPCTLDECFTHFSHCYPFRAYFYTPQDLTVASIDLPENIQLVPVTQTLYHGDYRTFDASNACVFVLLIEVLGAGSDPELSFLSSLPHWGVDGGNNIILVTEGIQYLNLDAFKRHSHAVLAFHKWEAHKEYRQLFDIHMLMLSIHANQSVTYNPPRFDIRRYVLLYPNLDRSKLTGYKNIDSVLSQLTIIKKQNNKKIFPIRSYNVRTYEANLQSAMTSPGYYGNINYKSIAVTDGDVIKLMGQSHFLLLFASFLEADQFYLLLKEALKGATIPVIVGGTYRLPFEEIIEWKRISVTWRLHR